MNALAIPHFNILTFPRGGAQQALERAKRMITRGGSDNVVVIGNSAVRVKAKSKVGSAWYAGALAAYQAIGAASYAASKVNLANPGTYNATDGAAASWDATNGWTFGGLSYLDTNVVPTLDGTWSMAIRYVNSGFSGFPTLAGQRENTSSYPDFAIVVRNGGDTTVFRNSHVTGYTHTYLSDGVVIMAGNKAYYNGSEIGTLTVGTATGTRAIYIGAQNEVGTALYFFSGTIQAVAIYNFTLSGAQAATLSTAMAALA